MPCCLVDHREVITIGTIGGGVCIRGAVISGLVKPFLNFAIPRARVDLGEIRASPAILGIFRVVKTVKPGRVQPFFNFAIPCERVDSGVVAFTIVIHANTIAIRNTALARMTIKVTRSAIAAHHLGTTRALETFVGGFRLVGAEMLLLVLAFLYLAIPRPLVDLGKVAMASGIDALSPWHALCARPDVAIGVPTRR